jgi:hypothetical protein
MAAYYIHAPVHEARPEIVSTAHCHTHYGTPFSATVANLEPISQESCAFFGDHEIFDDEEVSVSSTDGSNGLRRPSAGARGVILRKPWATDSRRHHRRRGRLLPVDGTLRGGSGEVPRRPPNRS